MSKKAIIVLVSLLGLAALAIAIAKFGIFLPQGGIMGLLVSGQPGFWLPILVFVSALVDSLNPCAFSVLLITIAFLFNLGRSRRRIVEAGGVYIFGIFLTYILIGLGVVQALEILNTPHFMAKVGASIVLLWGMINLAGAFWPSFPIKLKIPQAAHKKMAFLMERGTIFTSFILGILVGITEFPCTGGPYLFILGLLHDHTTQLEGLAYLFFYNIVFVLPLSVVLVIGSDHGLLTKLEEWKKANNQKVRVWTSVIMILLGLFIFQF